MTKKKNLRLLAQDCTREGYESYVDLYLVWDYNNKVYSVRVRPQFKLDYAKLIAQAETVPVGEPIEKYF